MKKLGVSGPKAKISLSILEKRNSPVDSCLVHALVVSDLNDNVSVKPHVLYSRPEIPVRKKDIPTQEDIDIWPHLNDVFIPRIDADIGLVIACDIPGAIDPVEMIQSALWSPHFKKTNLLGGLAP